ncbi:Golgi to ER traffic protein 4 homolog isoform X2 [Homalodisca vitripennis]|uniref:Golgi to ER traffic protein 4 homolog isoform X2 n=1 Tax=Homalodisca vitripennis TaxID=197043 RepID=UPI001EEB4E83|nr:Golgi to ER traffic protein 4 homolog isoform X2 [Homalodisca vitripennis]XP_046659908.1 Golgi to ER traffic protein 4 homolog isoform X2 [Homalodisca vitripennis]
MAESSQSKKPHGVQRVLGKLDSSVKNGNYYEAHQMYRTLYFRYLTQKKYGELLELLFDGAKLLLQHDQQTSGADLAILLVDVLVKSETEPSDFHISRLAQLFSMVSPEVAEREVFLGSALRWSSHDHAQFTNGHPSLHQAIAQIFWREKNFVLARYHFLHSRDGTGFATMLVELHRTRGFATEVDLFIAQVVLQYLCLQNKHTANVAFQSYTTQHPAIAKGPPYILPLLNFIFFLLKTVESGKLAAFTVLCEQYQPCIKRDPSYPQYLDKIAQIFFGVPPPRQHNSGGLLGNILQSLMNGLGENLDSDEEDLARPSTSRLMETEALD